MSPPLLPRRLRRGAPLATPQSAILLVSLLAMVPSSLLNAAEAAPVAGLAPYERPAGAPVIGTLAQTPEWTRLATRGITQPLPSGLKFVADQGAWYTPFTEPGMPGYYDIRNLHDNKSAAK
jgi:hypothetical protein